MHDVGAVKPYNYIMINIEQQDYYIIRVEGHLDIPWNGWFGEMRISHLENPCVTVLSGYVANQAELHAVLAKIRDLCLTLIAVDRILKAEPETREQAAPMQ